MGGLRDRDAIQADLTMLGERGQYGNGASMLNRRLAADVAPLLDRVAELEAQVERLTEERDLAIAHDTQPYPTAWAYEQACRVMHEAKAERDAAVAAEAALREQLASVRAATAGAIDWYENGGIVSGDELEAIRRAAAAVPSSEAPTTGAKLIAVERARQIEVEGYDREGDERQADDTLARAAACYATPERLREMVRQTGGVPEFILPTLWPWGREYWKPVPNDRVRELVKAGALIAAEIDRLTPPVSTQQPEKTERRVTGEVHTEEGIWTAVTGMDDTVESCLASVPTDRPTDKVECARADRICTPGFPCGGCPAPVSTQQPETTEPTEMTWNGVQISLRGDDFGSNDVLAWVQRLGGKARHVSPPDTSYGPRIAITAPDGRLLFVCPGDTVVMREWFGPCKESDHQHPYVEFSVRPGSREATE